MAMRRRRCRLCARCLARQQAGEHGDAAGGERAREILRHQHQRARQDVGEDEVERRGAAQHPVAIAVAAPDIDQRGDAVGAGVARGDAHRLGIDVARRDLAAPGLRRGDGEDAGAGAHVEHAPPRTSPRQAIEREQAAARRGVLASAEGGGGVDDERDAARRRAAAMVRAVDEIAPGGERREARLVLGEPVARGHALDGDVRRRRAARAPGQRQHRLDQRGLRLRAGEALDLPGRARRDRERAHRRAGRRQRRRRIVRARRIRRHHRDAPHAGALVMLQDQRLALAAPSPVDRCAVATLSRIAG
jgi:hypothetical protein